MVKLGRQSIVAAVPKRLSRKSIMLRSFAVGRRSGAYSMHRYRQWCPAGQDLHQVATDQIVGEQYFRLQDDTGIM